MRAFIQTTFWVWIEAADHNFWEAHHSQIYTTLAKLDQQGYVTVLDKDEHSQKKIYHLTDEGRALVEEWIKEETPAPTQKMNF